MASGSCANASPQTTSVPSKLVCAPCYVDSPVLRQYMRYSTVQMVEKVSRDSEKTLCKYWGNKSNIASLVVTVLLGKRPQKPGLTKSESSRPIQR